MMVTRAVAAPRTMAGSTVTSTSAREAGRTRRNATMNSPVAPRKRAGRVRRGTSGGPALVAQRGDDVRAALLVALVVDDLVLGRLLEQLRERREAVVRLVEGGVLADHRLLHHRAPQRLLV